jgi:hypothetical protein
MAHSDHVLDGINNDLVGRSRDDYLMMADGWIDPYGKPIIDLFRNFQVVRDDLIDAGSKGRFADLLVQRVKNDHLVYIAPQVRIRRAELGKDLQEIRQETHAVLCCLKEAV